MTARKPSERAPTAKRAAVRLSAPPSHCQTSMSSTLITPLPASMTEASHPRHASSGNATNPPVVCSTMENRCTLAAAPAPAAEIPSPSPTSSRRLCPNLVNTGSCGDGFTHHVRGLDLLACGERRATYHRPHPSHTHQPPAPTKTCRLRPCQLTFADALAPRSPP